MSLTAKGVLDEIKNIHKRKPMYGHPLWTGMVEGTISLNTWHSRTRRAISCAYCAPKSTTRTVSKDCSVT